MTNIVNLRHTNEYDVYIGRAGRGKDGTFGNPIVRGKACMMCHATHSTGGSTLNCYLEYLLIRLSIDVDFRQKVLELKGKTLACFCKPNPCHGDFLAQVVDILWDPERSSGLMHIAHRLAEHSPHRETVLNRK